MTTSPVEFALAFSTGLVAFVFALSGSTKLGHSSDTLKAMSAIGAPVALRRLSVARLVPVAEIALAVLLVTLPGILLPVAGAVSTLVLAVFTVLLIGVLRRGDAVDCGCFGVLSTDDRVTSWSIVRNVVLLATSIVIAAFGFTSGGFVPDLLAADLPTLLTLALAWALTAVVVLIRGSRKRGSAPLLSGVQSSRSRETAPAPLSPSSLALGIDPTRPNEAFAGDPIPTAEVVSQAGVTQTLEQLAGNRPVLLFFLSAGCGSCAPVAAAIPGWANALAPMPLHVVTSSTPSELETAYPGLLPLARFGSLAALVALGVQRSPAAVALGGADGIVASPIAYGIEEISGLVTSVASARGVVLA